MPSSALEIPRFCFIFESVSLSKNSEYKIKNLGELELGFWFPNQIQLGGNAIVVSSLVEMVLSTSRGETESLVFVVFAI